MMNEMSMDRSSVQFQLIMLIYNRSLKEFKFPDIY